MVTAVVICHGNMSVIYVMTYCFLCNPTPQMHIISGCQLVGIHHCPLYPPVLMSIGSPENWKSHLARWAHPGNCTIITASDCPFCVIMHEHRQWPIRFF